VEPEPTLKNGSNRKATRVGNFLITIFMQTVSSTKTILTDIIVEVWLKQSFEVPVDYEINEATPKEAYERLISEFGDQNVDAVQEPCELDLMDVVSIDFNFIGEEFFQIDNQTNELNIKRFKIKKIR
jgi:hypothetical protein